MTHFQHGAIQKGTRRYVSARVATKTTVFECPSCHKDVIFRAGSRRVHHFAHKAKNACTFYGHDNGTRPTESDEHKHAKLALAELLEARAEIEIDTFCEHQSIRDTSVPCETARFQLGATQRVSVEHRADDGCIYDVAVLDADDSVACVFEVTHTHATETARPEPWFEIRASDVGDTAKLRCIRTNRRVCAKCESRVRQIEEERRRDEEKHRRWLEEQRLKWEREEEERQRKIKESHDSCTGTDMCYRACGSRCKKCATAEIERSRLDKEFENDLFRRYTALVDSRRLGVRSFNSYRGPDPPEGLDGNWYVVPDGGCRPDVVRRFGVDLEVPDAKTDRALRERIKRKGARWDPDGEQWFVPAEQFCRDRRGRIELIEQYGLVWRVGAKFEYYPGTAVAWVRCDSAPSPSEREFLRKDIQGRWDGRVWRFPRDKLDMCVAYFDECGYDCDVTPLRPVDSGFVDD